MAYHRTGRANQLEDWCPNRSYVCRATREKYLTASKKASSRSSGAPARPWAEEPCSRADGCEHRESRDLDIFIAVPRFDALFPLVNKMQMAMQARLDPTIEPREWTNHQAGVLVIRVTSPDADVELIRDPHRSLTRDWTHGEETVESTTRRLKTVSTIAVLQRKLEKPDARPWPNATSTTSRGPARCERPTLDQALDRCSYPTIRHFARLLENLTEVPAREEEHKPVVHPKWEKWRTEAPPILRQTIGETLTRWNTLHRSGPAKSIGE